MQTTLNNGMTMPLLGLGVYDMYGREAETAILNALEIGYRLIDTAAMYRNETEVGNAVRASGIPRSELFITTKLNNNSHGYDAAMRAFETSERNLNCGQIDLYLIHWPVKGKRAETWKALEQIYTEKRVKAIGVANYLEPFLDELLPAAAVVPVVNQVEFSPYLYLRNLLERCQHEQIVLQAYTPLARGARFGDPKLIKLAEKYAKSPAQIMLRWILQHGVSAIPKSVSRERLLENYAVFDFELSDSDMTLMDGFHENLRVVDDPITML